MDSSEQAAKNDDHQASDSDSCNKRCLNGEEGPHGIKAPTR